MDVYGFAAWQVALAGLAWVLVFQVLGGAAWRAWWLGADAGPEFGKPLPAPLVLFFQQTLGMAMAAMLLLVVALAGQFTVGGVSAALGIACVIAAWFMCRAGWRQAPRAIAPLGWEAWEVLVLLCAALATAFAVWRFPGFWDDTAYHLPMARFIVEHERLEANEWLRFPYFPAYMQLLFAGGLLQDATLAQWLANWPVVITLAGLMGMAAWWGWHAAWGGVAWLLYLTAPMVNQIFGFAYVDTGITLFATAAIAAAAIWAHMVERHRLRWLVLAGACAGVAAGIKLQGLMCAAALGVAVLCLWVGKRSWQDRLRDAAVFGLSCVAVCAFWYVRSYWLTGDPIHPAGGKWFGFYLWTADDLAAQAAEQATHGVPKSWANIGAGFWHVKALYMLGAVVVPAFRWGRRASLLLTWLVVMLLMLFWFWISQVDRYLMPAMPLGALLATGFFAQGIAQLTARARKLAHVLLMVLASVCAVGTLLNAYTKLQDRPGMAAQRDAQAAVLLIKKAESLAPRYGKNLLNVGYESLFFHYQGQMMGDWFGPAAFARLIQCTTVCGLRPEDELVAVMRGLNVRLLLVNAQRFPFEEKNYDGPLRLIEKRGAAYLYALDSP